MYTDDKGQVIKPKRLQYKNASRKELIFTDGTFIVYTELPTDHMRLFNKDLLVHECKIYYKTFHIATIGDDFLVTWVSTELFKFPIID